MGCVLSSGKSLMKTGESAKTENNEPDEVDMVLVLESWKKLKSNGSAYALIGTEIFFRILAESAQKGNLFGFDQVKPADRARKIERHGKMMRDELSRLLNAWSPTSGNNQLKRDARKIGALHYNRLKKYRIQEPLWDLFPPVLLEAVGPYCDDIPASHGPEEVLAAWYRLAVYLVDLMKAGWNDGLLRDIKKEEERERKISIKQKKIQMNQEEKERKISMKRNKSLLVMEERDGKISNRQKKSWA